MSISRTRIQPINFLQKGLENIITLDTSENASTTLSNGQGATFTITTTGTSTNRTFVIHDFTVYIGSQSNANKLPNGSGVNMTQWYVFAFPNDFGDTNNINTVTKVYVQNVSAGANQTVLLYVQARIIQNSTTIGGAEA